jgi:4-amino-4-deoxy-L-arabinose transferase-like glycosyltransferase
LATGFKGIQGSYIFFAYSRRMDPRPEAILGHEEAFFFGIFIILTCALWLYDRRGPLRRTATGLLPFVVIADLANARRTAWLIIAAAVITILVVSFRTLSHRRTFVVRAFVILLVGSALYLPAYWNHDGGTLAQPARAVHSQVSPDARDQSSNLYRQQENLNLVINIKSAGVLGTGFGIPIAYVAQIANISSIDPMIAYIPHNGLLWIWLRMGLQGEIVFWCLISVALVRACRLALVKDQRLAMIGTLVACALVSYVIEGYEDLGFGQLRIAIAMGCLLGMMEAATRLARAGNLKAVSDTEPARRIASSHSPTYVGA